MGKGAVIVLSIIAGAVIIGSAIRTSQNDSDNDSESLPIISVSEVAQADGKGDNPCYVSLENTVYEIKQGNKWKDGDHVPSEGQAYCGIDATEIIGSSPHGKSILSILTEVGKLQN